MNSRLRNAIADWDAEVETEAIRLIERGTPPYDAVERARNIVERRRREAAERSEQAALHREAK
jgi:hypothetical protein